MRFGLNTFLYASPFTNESTKLFKTFKKWGFDTVEIPVEALEHIDPAKVKAAADKVMADHSVKDLVANPPSPAEAEAWFRKAIADPAKDHPAVVRGGHRLDAGL